MKMTYNESADNPSMCYPSRETSIDEFLLEMVSLLNSHDRGVKTMSDPDWLEIVGHPTIPHVQSLRQPPSHVALQGNSREDLIGITSKNASKRYLQKLKRERQQNQEALTECVDNLPIVIRQMVYPEKPATKQTSRIGTGHSLHSREKKFRIGRHQNDYWHDNINQWVKDDERPMEDAPTQATCDSGLHFERKYRHGSPIHSTSTEKSAAINNEFVHHQGFQGQSTNGLKYKYPKKKGPLGSEKSSVQTQSTFRPKGFGSLYDELEFERRYKKVLDLNKHIHFVHSNFLNGQRIVKRTKLPPIGHVPSSTQSDPSEGGDIFAIMSVQKYNHPEGYDVPHAPTTTPGRHYRQFSAEGSPEKRHRRRYIEIAQEVGIPTGFVPGTTKPTGSSPFEGVNGSTTSFPEETSYRMPVLSREDDSALGTLTEEYSNTPWGDDFNGSHSERSMRTLKSKQTKHPNEVKVKALKKKRMFKSDTDGGSIKSFSTDTPDETEPFNISVHVEIKPKDQDLTGGDDYENDLAREKCFASTENRVAPDATDNHQEEKVLYPTKIASHEEDDETLENEFGTQVKVIRPKNVFVTSNHMGFVTQKVQYPDRFVLANSLAEEDETQAEINENDANALNVSVRGNINGLNSASSGLTANKAHEMLANRT